MFSCKWSFSKFISGAIVPPFPSHFSNPLNTNNINQPFQSLSWNLLNQNNIINFFLSKPFWTSTMLTNQSSQNILTKQYYIIRSSHSKSFEETQNYFITLSVITLGGIKTNNSKRMKTIMGCFIQLCLANGTYKNLITISSW